MSTRFCKASRHFFLVAYFSGLRQEKPIPWPEYRQRKEGKNILKYKLFKPTTKSPAVWCIIFLQRAPLASAKVSCCAVIKKLATISERKHTTVAICCVASVAHLACEKSNKSHVLIPVCVADTAHRLYILQREISVCSLGSLTRRNCKMINTH